MASGGGAHRRVIGVLVGVQTDGGFAVGFFDVEFGGGGGDVQEVVVGSVDDHLGGDI